MIISLWVNGKKFCEDFNWYADWSLNDKYRKCMGTIDNGRIRVPDNVEGEVGQTYNFESTNTANKGLRWSFKGILLESSIGDKYVEIVSDILEEEL